VIILIWLMLFSPGIPISLLWLRSPESGLARLAVGILTCSYAWLIVALISPWEGQLLGASYSNLRITIPYANVAVVAVVMIVLVIRAQKTTAVLACMSTILCWLYVRVISFAV